MKTKVWILVVLVAIFVLVAIYTTLPILGLRHLSTSSDPPLDRETFISLYVDLEIAAEKAGIGTPDYEAVRDSILSSYSTTFDEVTGMLSSYDTEPEKWAEIWEGILAELEKRKSALTTPDSGATH